MKAIGSSNGYYVVAIRGLEKPIRMSINGGEKLSKYLVGDVGMFVEIKDTSGVIRVIRTATIDRVERYEPTQTHYKTADELGMPDLTAGAY